MFLFVKSACLLRLAGSCVHIYTYVCIRRTHIRTVYGHNGIGWELDLLTPVDAKVHVAKEAAARLCTKFARVLENFLPLTYTCKRSFRRYKRHINAVKKYSVIISNVKKGISRMYVSLFFSESLAAKICRVANQWEKNTTITNFRKIHLSWYFFFFYSFATQDILATKLSEKKRETTKASKLHFFLTCNMTFATYLKPQVCTR